MRVNQRDHAAVVGDGCETCLFCIAEGLDRQRTFDTVAAGSELSLRHQLEAAVDLAVVAAEEEVRVEDVGVLELVDRRRAALMSATTPGDEFDPRMR